MSDLEPFVIATHQKPDADALAATWLACRFLHGGRPVQVVFVPRSFAVTEDCPFGCVVDVGRQHLPHRLVFDHKPPGIADRNSTCATRLIWDHMVAAGADVQHLRELVVAVHEGDRVPPRANARAFVLSKQEGFHAYLAGLPRKDLPDGEVFSLAAAWLDGYERRCRGSDRLPAVAAYPRGSNVTLAQRYVRGLELASTAAGLRAAQLTKAMVAKLTKLAVGAIAAKFSTDTSNLKDDLKLAQWIDQLAANCGPELWAVLASAEGRLTPKVIGQISHCTAERQRYELNEVAQGRRPFVKPKFGLPPQDTHDFYEVYSRVARGTGRVKKWADKSAKANSILPSVAGAVGSMVGFLEKNNRDIPRMNLVVSADQLAALAGKLTILNQAIGRLMPMKGVPEKARFVAGLSNQLTSLVLEAHKKGLKK